MKKTTEQQLTNLDYWLCEARKLFYTELAYHNYTNFVRRAKTKDEVFAMLPIGNHRTTAIHLRDAFEAAGASTPIK
jgi:hypothetical protein